MTHSSPTRSLPDQRGHKSAPGGCGQAGTGHRSSGKEPWVAPATAKSKRASALWLRRPPPNRDQKRGERSRSARRVRYAAGRHSNGGPMTIAGSLARAARALVQLPRDHIARLAALDASALADFEAGRDDLDDDAQARLRHAREERDTRSKRARSG